MKRQLILATLILVSRLAICDAIFLPTGSQLILGGIPTTLDSPRFLLTRTDMEAAVLAQETVEIQKEQIAKLTVAYGNMAKTAIFAGIAGVFLAVLAEEVIHHWGETGLLLKAIKQ
jgi:hypothetical protein